MTFRAKYKNILLDLDGTLTDPAEGITKSIAYALESMGILVEDLNDLKRFIGPPLKDTFITAYGFDESAAFQAVAKYRERFAAVGLYENQLFEGIPSLLESLKLEGYDLFLATSKPEIFAIKILQHFQLDSFFSFIGGAALDESRPSKGHVIDYVMKESNLNRVEKCVMIGDREHDVLGAKWFNMSSVGVLYGFGDREELEQAGADYIVDSIPELERLLRS